MIDWKDIVLRPDDTMEQAIRVLDDKALRIVLVVDSDMKLLGTVTDGDIRRALINQGKMSDKLVNVMFNYPEIASTEDSRECIFEIMKNKDIQQVPIVDTNGRVVGLEILRNFFEENKLDNPVFIMAGGFGTRLSPLTNDTPKPLLKVGCKSILETIIHQFIKSGFHNFFISTHYKAEMIHEYFGDGSQWDISIQYVHEDTPLGTAGALGLLPLESNDLPILMMNADLLTKINFENLLNFHNDQVGIATMCVREYDFQVPYGVVEYKDYQISKVIEKPIQKFFVNAGIYVLEPSFINQIEGNNFLDMPHLINQHIEKDSRINIFPLHEYWLDIGQIEQLEQAQIDSRSLF